MMAHTDSDEFLQEFFGVFPWLMAIAGILSLVQYGWYYSVALGLRKFTPESVRLKTTPFVISFTLVIISLVCMFSFLIFIFQDFESMESFIRPSNFLGFMAICLLMLFLVFYMIYYTAKAYKTALLKRKVQRDEVIGEFFMGLFLFIGVWLLQPKINELIKGEENPPLADSEGTDFTTYSN